MDYQPPVGGAALQLIGPDGGLEGALQQWIVRSNDLQVGDRVEMGWGGEEGPGACPYRQLIGGWLCLDIRNPARRMATTTAVFDPSTGGARAVFDLNVPRTWRDEIHMQALLVRGQTSSISNVVPFEIYTPGNCPDWYADNDGDGYGDPGNTVNDCNQPSGYVSDSTDCNDADGDIRPGVTEVCDGVDNDCNAFTDDADPDLSSVGALYFADDDNDGYGTTARHACTNFGFGWTDTLGDCDDNRSDIYPGATEVCDGRDNDCNGPTDDNAIDASNFFRDDDRDGWGTDEILVACSQPYNGATQEGDCDDARSNINPDATEICDNQDNDCNGITDFDTVGLPEWYEDVDGDGYGLEGTGLPACSAFDGRVDNDDDCDDADAAVSPGETEIDANGIDDDCDGAIDTPTPIVGVLIDVDTTWGTTDSLLSVGNNLLVTAGTTLTIEPCTRVLFDPGTTLQIEGTLIARSTPECPIVLTSGAIDPAPGDWARLFFTATSEGATYDLDDNYVSGSILENVEILYSGGTGAAVRIEAPLAPDMDHVRIAHSGATGIDSVADNMLIRDSIFEDNQGTGVRTSDAYNFTSILNSRFSRNSQGFNLSGGCCGASGTLLQGNLVEDHSGSGAYVTGNGGGAWTITDNVFVNNGGSGMDSFAAFGRWERNIFANNGSAGWSGGYSGVHEVYNNVMADNGMGITTQYGGTHDVRNNHIVRNSQGYSSSNSWTPTHMWSDNLFQGQTSASPTMQFDYLSSGSSPASLVGSNFIGAQGAYLFHVSYSAGTPVIGAEGNYWDGADLAGARSMVYDFVIDASYAVADIDPVLATPNLDAPVSYPVGVSVTGSGDYVLTWLGNPESDVTGYRVWYGFGDSGMQLLGTGATEGDSGFSVAGTGATVSGLDGSLLWRFAVTAVDADADGVDDIFEGHESWFSEVVLP